MDATEFARLKRNQAVRDWMDRNPEKVAAYRKEYYQRNKERFRQYQKRYRETHRDKINAYQNERRRRLKEERAEMDGGD